MRSLALRLLACARLLTVPPLPAAARLCYLIVGVRAHRHYDEAIQDLVLVMQKGIPEPYTFSDLMMHIAWCYELKALMLDDPFSRNEAKGAFATAYKALPGTEQAVRAALHETC